MDPVDILNVRFHFGGEFIRIGPKLDYVGGDEGFSEIERDKLSLQEVKGFVKDHVELKESMKYYFHIPGKELLNGLLFLNNDSVCVKMSDYICVGGVADVYVEYHGEEDSHDTRSGSDFEDDELVHLSDLEPDQVISAEPAEDEHDVLVLDETGVITQVLSSPVKQQKIIRRRNDAATDREDTHSDSDSDSDTEYMPHSEDSGEDSEVVQLRRHARKFKKRMRESKSWIGMDSTGPIPIDLVANMEVQLEGEEDDWNYDSSDENYNYDEDSDGQIVKRKSKYPRYNNDTEIPHFSLSMVFRSKNQLCKALRRYGIVTKRSIELLKSESDRVRAKCGWPGCPWLLYAAKDSRTSRMQVVTFNDEHHCA
ncbi:uncharacterized protein [Aegilops tauschii subsp. strangulata]|uniref:uncharacterized protein isoform X2 n=1 Tax=Aegilops tauschii subsp. strangulata TaxID=200361 RepID=UPI001E1CA3F3|nr:uncharacterized protein LOC109770657 [Aegilops tauschii subsp. strangulata]